MSTAAVAAATAANQNAMYEAQMLAAAAMQSSASHVHLSESGAALMAPGYGALGSGCYPQQQQQQQYSLPAAAVSQTQNAAAAQAAAAFALAAFMKNNNNGANKTPILQQQQFMTPDIEQMIYQQQLQQQQQQNHLHHPQLIIDNNNGLGYSAATTNMSYHIGNQQQSLVKNNNSLLALQQQQQQQQMQNTAVAFQNKQQLQSSSMFAVPGLPLNPTPSSPSTAATAFEGSPIFLVPQSGILSLNALQRAKEFKLAQYAAAAASAGMTTGSRAMPTVTALSIPPKVDTSKHFHVFVGDLSTDVDNETLKNAFESKCGPVSEAKVMRDPQSLKSRGYGFVAFPKKENAQKALDLMTGEVIGKRPIRVNWAQRRTSTYGGTLSISSYGITTGATIITADGNASSASVSAANYASDDEKLSPSGKPSDAKSLDAKAANNSDECGAADDGVAAAIRFLMEATDAENTTVYLGNFQFVNKGLDRSGHDQIPLGAGNQQIRDAFERQVRSAFKRFGEIKEVRLYAGSGNSKAAIPFTPNIVNVPQQQHYGFVIFERKECAARAIHAMNGQPLDDTVTEDDGSAKDDATLQRILVRSTSLKCSWGRSGTSSSTPSLQSENGYPAMAAQMAAVAATATAQHAVTANRTIAAAAHNANLMAQMMGAAKWPALQPTHVGVTAADILAQQQQQLQAIGLHHQQSFLPQSHLPIMPPSSSTGFYYDPQLAVAAAAAAATTNKMAPYH